MMIKDPSGKIRIEQRSIRDGECIRWTGRHIENGYGQISINGKYRGVHRVAYELAHGPIPPGLQVDHLCCVRDCINIDHLEVVTAQENSQRVWDRGRHPGNHNGDRTVCRRGHPLSGNNVKIEISSEGVSRRVCLACRNMKEACPECGKLVNRFRVGKHLAAIHGGQSH